MTEFEKLKEIVNINRNNMGEFFFEEPIVKIVGMPCEFCLVDIWGDCKIKEDTELSYHIIERDDLWYLESTSDHKTFVSVPISHCPHCGREL